MTATPVVAARADRVFLVDLLEGAGSTGSVYSGPRLFGAKPPRIESVAGVWQSAAACGMNCGRLDRLAMDHLLGAC